MAAFDAETGELLPFSHTFASPDYAGPASGSLRQDLQPGTAPKHLHLRHRLRDPGLAATARRCTSAATSRRWTAAARQAGGVRPPRRCSHLVRRRGVYGKRVRALAVEPRPRLYFGGGFTQVGGQPARAPGRGDTVHGSADAVASAATDGNVIALGAVNPTGRAGDRGRRLRPRQRRAAPRRSMAVAPRRARTARWVADPPARAGGRARSFATDLAVHGDTVYVATARVTRFDGRVALDPLQRRDPVDEHVPGRHLGDRAGRGR